MSDYITQENKEKWLSRLAEEPPCNYAPFGDDGPCVSMESSVYLINRYCRRINRGDFSNLYAQLLTTTKDLTENCVEFVSKLYLPLRSYCCSVVQGDPVQVNKGNKIDLEVGRLKSRMLACLECVKLLHRCGKMDDDLDLIEEVYIDASSENVQDLELDEGKGKAGTNKRRRAYEIKAPSFFEDNMPRANETCFLYKIAFEDPTVYKHSKSGSLQNLTQPEIEFGILSRKPLPKIPSFQVYTSKSDVTVFLEARNPLKIDETMLERIRTFHHYVFKELYKLSNQLTTLSGTDGYLAVPLVPKTPSPTTTQADKNCRVHYDFLQDLSTFFQATTDPDVNLNCNAPHKDFSFFQSKIVRRVNESANQTHYTRYFVTKVCHDLSPSSPFPDQEVAATFADYYENRYGIQVNLQQPLLLVQHVPTQVNFAIPRLRNQTNEELSFKGPKTEIHLVPELCCVLPLSASAWSLARYLPAVVYRLEAMLRAHEMKLKLVNGINEGTEDLRQVKKYAGNGDKLQSFSEVDERNNLVGPEYTDDAGDSCGNDDGDSDHDHVGAGCVVDVVGNISASGNDDDGVGNVNGGIGSTDASSNDGLTISLMLHALTAKSVGQQFHSEQLELLGDSFLKLEVSLELFLTDPDKDEWVLSVYRKHLISNDMLSTQGRRLGIAEYITVTPPDLTNTSVPPGFIFETSQGGKSSSLNLYTHQVLGDKNVANSVEALIGATVVGCGRTVARQLLIWLGVAQYSSCELDAFYQRLQAHRTGTYKNSEEEMPGIKEQQYSIPCKMKEIVNNTKLDDSGHLLWPVPNFDHIEREVGYFFKNKFLLLEALTHSSYPRFLSQISESYQKMEFVGDAILDYLVTMYIYKHFPELNHGDVTDFRSGLVNNFTLAFLAVQKNLHQSLRHMSPQLLDVIGQFLEFLEKQELKQGASWKTSVDAFVVGASEVEESLIEVPKVLGDVFEALVCAIFLDSGMNLELVWKIVFPMFMPFIEYYKDNIPRSPIRVLKETFPEIDRVTFSLARLTLSRKYKSSVCVTGYGKFEAIGRTPKIAKASVARKALQNIRSQEDMKQN